MMLIAFHAAIIDVDAAAMPRYAPAAMPAHYALARDMLPRSAVDDFADVDSVSHALPLPRP